MVFHHIVLLHCNGQGPLHLNKDPPKKKTEMPLTNGLRKMCASCVHCQ